MEKIKIVRMDDQGRGIGYLNGKIVFVPDSLEGEELLIEITCDKKSYSVGKIIEYVTKSKKRKDVLCPYFNGCGGCQLLNMEYNDTLQYKKEKIKNLLIRNKLDFPELSVIENPSPFNYRNKIELKIENGKIGYYQNDTHQLVWINKCLIASFAINNFLEDIEMLKIKDGKLTIRSNYNDELLLIIDTNNKINIDIEKIKEKHKLVGIILNNKPFYGDTFFIDKVNKYLFRVSYDAFFQVNREVCSKMFDLVENCIDPNSVVLDLYAGVGTLGIVASKKAKKVYSLEIVLNAIKDGTVNAKMNKRENIHYMYGDVAKNISKIKDDIDTVIVDPPRKGLDNKTIDYLIDKKFKKIIYISCDPLTLVRDLKKLKEDYVIKNFSIMDMFSNTYHVESFVVLEKR